MEIRNDILRIPQLEEYFGELASFNLPKPISMLVMEKGKMYWAILLLIIMMAGITLKTN